MTRPQETCLRCGAPVKEGAGTGTTRFDHRALESKAIEVLNDIYPAVAGRATLLKEAGELNAFEHWKGYARQIYEVIVQGRVA